MIVYFAQRINTPIKLEKQSEQNQANLFSISFDDSLSFIIFLNSSIRWYFFVQFFRISTGKWAMYIVHGMVYMETKEIVQNKKSTKSFITKKFH